MKFETIDSIGHLIACFPLISMTTVYILISLLRFNFLLVYVQCRLGGLVCKVQCQYSVDWVEYHIYLRNGTLVCLYIKTRLE